MRPIDKDMSGENYERVLARALPTARVFITTPGRDDFRSEAYKDPGGVWTIGFGFTAPALGRVVQAGDRMTLAEANSTLDTILTNVASRVWHSLKFVPNGDQFAAMISLAYNMGTGSFAQSGLVREWNLGMPLDQVSDEFMAIVHDRSGAIDAGLVKRRRAEQTLFLSGAKPLAQAKTAPQSVSEADKLNQGEIDELKGEA